MPTEKTVKAEIRKRQKQSEQRRIMMILIIFVLTIFSLGTNTSILCSLQKSAYRNLPHWTPHMPLPA